MKRSARGSISGCDFKHARTSTSESCPLCSCVNVNADESVTSLHFHGCNCGKIGRLDRNKKVTEDLLTNYNLLLERVQRHDLWHYAVSKHAVIKKLMVGQRICDACWQWDRHAIRDPNGFPRYFVNLMLPELIRMKNSSLPCLICLDSPSARSALRAFDAECTSVGVASKLIPGHLIGSVNFFFATIYGCTHVLTGSGKEICWPHWTHWFYGLPNAILHQFEVSNGDTWIPERFQICVICNVKRNRDTGHWTLYGVLSGTEKVIVDTHVPKNVEPSDFDWICGTCCTRNSLGNNVTDMDVQESMASGDEAGIDELVDNADIANPRDETTVVTGTFIDLSEGFDTMDMQKPLKVNWDEACALQSLFQNHIDSMSVAMPSTIARAAAGSAMIDLIQDLKKNGFSTYDKVKTLFTNFFMQVVLDMDDYTLANRLKWHRWLPRLRASILDLVNTLQCGVHRVQSSALTGSISMLFYDQSIFPNQESYPKLLSGLGQYTGSTAIHNNEVSSISSMTLFGFRQLLRQQQHVFRNLDMTSFPWAQALPASGVSLHSTNLTGPDQGSLTREFCHVENNAQAKTSLDGNDDTDMSQYSLQSLFIPKLMAVMEYLTARSKRRLGPDPNSKEGVLKAWKLATAICQIIAASDNKAQFMQHLMAFICKAGGLSVEKWDHLSRAGVIVSRRTFRRTESAVNARWDPANALSGIPFGHSLDNCNFQHSYSWSIVDGNGTIGRMLNVLAGQSAFLNEEDCDEEDKYAYAPPPGQELEKPKFIVQYRTKGDGLTQFILPEHDQKWETFTHLFVDAKKQIIQEQSLGEEQKYSRFLYETIQDLGGWTPSKGHEIRISTVMKGESATLSDIVAYLDHIYDILHIGKQDGPAQLLVVADQQVYALLIQAKQHYPDRFNWMVPMPGHWHICFNAATQLMLQVWDGGAKEVAAACGLPNMKPTAKWQDLHMVLTVLWSSLTEMLLKLYQAEYCTCENAGNNSNRGSVLATEETGGASTSNTAGNVDRNNSETMRRKELKSWIKSAGMHTDENCALTDNNSDFFLWMESELAKKREGFGCNQNLQFWASWWRAITAYMGLFSGMRSGSWDLIMASVLRLAPLFFAFKRPKYMDLMSRHITDAVLMPGRILRLLKSGKLCSVSLYGRKGRNVAWDESIEIINKYMKTNIPRPSEIAVTTKIGMIDELIRILKGIEVYFVPDTDESDGIDDDDREKAAHMTPSVKRSDQNSKGKLEILAVRKTMTLLEPIMKLEPQPLRRSTAAGFGQDNVPLEALQVRSLLDFYTLGQQQLLDYMRQIRMSPAYELPAPAVAKCFTFSKTQVRQSRAEKTREKETGESLAAMRNRLKRAIGFKALSDMPEALYDSKTGLKRKADKAQVIKLLQDELGKENIQSLLCPWQDYAYLSGFSEGADAEMCAEVSHASNCVPQSHAVGIDGLRIVHRGCGPARMRLGEFGERVARSTLRYFHAGATTVVWLADRHTLRSPVRDTIRHERSSKSSGVSIPDAIPSTLDDFMFTGKVHDAALQAHPEYKEAILRSIATKLAELGSKIGSTKRDGALDPMLVIDIEYSGSSSHPLVVPVASRSIKWAGIPQPWMLFLLIYILGGSDYVPAWFGIGHKSWYKCIQTYSSFIHQVPVPAGDETIPQGATPLQVSLSRPILNKGLPHCTSAGKLICSMVRMSPGDEALKGQCLRASYVLRLIFESVVEGKSQIKLKHTEFGWKVTNSGLVSIDWGSPASQQNAQQDTRNPPGARASNHGAENTRRGCTCKTKDNHGLLCNTSRCKCIQCGPACACSGKPCAKRQQGHVSGQNNRTLPDTVEQASRPEMPTNFCQGNAQNVGDINNETNFRIQAEADSDCSDNDNEDACSTDGAESEDAWLAGSPSHISREIMQGDDETEQQQLGINQ